MSKFLRVRHNVALGFGQRAKYWKLFVLQPKSKSTPSTTTPTTSTTSTTPTTSTTSTPSTTTSMVLAIKKKKITIFLN